MFTGESAREFVTLSTAEERHASSIVFAPDDRHLVAAAPDYHLLVWDLEALRTRLADFGLGEESANRAAD